MLELAFPQELCMEKLSFDDCARIRRRPEVAAPLLLRPDISASSREFIATFSAQRAL